jgi:hypothetical protein
MRKFFLVALAAAAMVVVALPSTSVAGGSHGKGGKQTLCPSGKNDRQYCIPGEQCPPGTHNPDYCIPVEQCPPGTHNRQYCVPEQCPPGTHDRQYCEHHQVCPDTATELQETSDAGAAAGLAAAELLTDRSGSISFSFTPKSCGDFTFTLEFAIPGHHHHPKYIVCAEASSTTTAGKSDSTSADLSVFCKETLARYAAEGKTLDISVITQASKGGTTESSQVYGSFLVTHGSHHHHHHH